MHPFLKDVGFETAALALAAMLAGALPSAVALAQTAPPAATYTASSDSTVRALQEALVKQGIAVKTDGVLSDETRNGIRKYQSQHHLAVTGEPDQATLDKLGVASRQGALPDEGTPQGQAPTTGQAPDDPANAEHSHTHSGSAQGGTTADGPATGGPATQSSMQGMMNMMQGMMQMMQGRMQPGQMQSGQMEPGQMQPGQIRPGQMRHGHGQGGMMNCPMMQGSAQESAQESAQAPSQMSMQGMMQMMQGMMQMMQGQMMQGQMRPDAR